MSIEKKEESNQYKEASRLATKAYYEEADLEEMPSEELIGNIAFSKEFEDLIRRYFEEGMDDKKYYGEFLKLVNSAKEKKEEKKMSLEEEKQLDGLERGLRKILDETDRKIGDNLIMGTERDTLRIKQENIGKILSAVFKKVSPKRVLRFIKEAEGLSKAEKDSFFRIVGTSLDEFIQKENQEKEIIEKLKRKMREYVASEDEIIKEENAKDESERNVNRLNNAITRKSSFEYMISRNDWDLEFYNESIIENSKNAIIINGVTKKKFASISSLKLAELMKIIAGEEVFFAEEEGPKISPEKPSAPTTTEEKPKIEVEAPEKTKNDEKIAEARLALEKFEKNYQSIEGSPGVARELKDKIKAKIESFRERLNNLEKRV